LITLEQWASRNGSTPLPPDPAPRKLKIQPHAHEAAAARVAADHGLAEEDEADEDASDWEDDEDSAAD
jgi:hypothetical protein